MPLAVTLVSKVIHQRQPHEFAFICFTLEAGDSGWQNPGREGGHRVAAGAPCRCGRPGRAGMRCSCSPAPGCPGGPAPGVGLHPLSSASSHPIAGGVRVTWRSQLPRGLPHALFLALVLRLGTSGAPRLRAGRPVPVDQVRAGVGVPGGVPGGAPGGAPVGGRRGARPPGPVPGGPGWALSAVLGTEDFPGEPSPVTGPSAGHSVSSTNH